MDQLFPEAKTYFASHKLIHLIGEYSYKMRITGNWFVNFADAVPLLTYPPSLLYKYGQLFEDKVMKQYAAFMMTYVGHGTTKDSFLKSMIDGAMGGDLNEFWNFVITRKDIEAEKAEAPEADLVWLPDIQVFNARSKKTVPEKSRFFLAGKAGSNRKFDFVVIKFFENSKTLYFTRRKPQPQRRRQLYPFPRWTPSAH